MRRFTERDCKELLVVEDDEIQRISISELIGDEDVCITAVGTGEAALLALENKEFDCVVLDLSLPDMGGFELLKQIKQQARYGDLPGRHLHEQGPDAPGGDPTQEVRRDHHHQGRRLVRAPLDETALFLHRVVERMPASKRKIVERRHRRPAADEDGSGSVAAAPPPPVLQAPAPPNPEGADVDLAGRKVLIVDDDVRNIFALTSVLEAKTCRSCSPKTGATASRCSKARPTSRSC
jgi:CheY-like chemotaxis protein